MPVLVSRFHRKYFSFNKYVVWNIGSSFKKFPTSVICVNKTRVQNQCSFKNISFQTSFPLGLSLGSSFYRFIRTPNPLFRTFSMEGDKDPSNVDSSSQSVSKSNENESISDSNPSEKNPDSEISNVKCEDTLRLEKNKYDDVGKAAKVLQNNWKEIEEAVSLKKTTDRVRKKKSKKKVFVDSDCEEYSDDENSRLRVKLPNRNYIGLEQVSNNCRAVIIQCCSSFETSNVVLKKTNSDTEDVPDEIEIKEIKNDKVNNPCLHAIILHNKVINTYFINIYILLY
ncbi:uncharacterized protein LOC111044057 [Nilaparvata lugens]|uniref:uncharacterized protein LOC111044057 n=1 Tax=Nilaparvata lugens TaxID=108931 RepID=UPI00193D80CB|nr:uncharacterized protein LOC111044057 [Nilaparvata lugens]